MAKYLKTAMKYFEKHTGFNGMVHLSLGVGIGALLTYPAAGLHPVRFALVFIVLGLLGHAWAMTHKA